MKEEIIAWRGSIGDLATDVCEVLDRNLVVQLRDELTRMLEKEPQKFATIVEPKLSLEMVDHPAHYGGGDNPYEAIKVIEAWELDFCLGNTVKYIARHEKKGTPLEDLKKSRWYLNHEIEQLGASLLKKNA